MKTKIKNLKHFVAPQKKPFDRQLLSNIFYKEISENIEFVFFCLKFLCLNTLKLFIIMV